MCKNIYDLNELEVRPKGRPMVWVYLVWGIYDGKAELRCIASDKTRAEMISKGLREEFKFSRDVRGRVQIRIDEVEVDHAFGACMTSLTATDLDPELQETRKRLFEQIKRVEKEKEDYLAIVRKKAKERGIL